MVRIRLQTVNLGVFPKTGEKNIDFWLVQASLVVGRASGQYHPNYFDLVMSSPRAASSANASLLFSTF